MSEGKLIFNGGEKMIFETADPDEVLIRYKDETTAFRGLKRAVFPGKGAIDCKISSLIFELLAKAGVDTHFIRTVSENEQLCRKVEMIPIHVIVRNYIAGSTADMLGLEDGFKPSNVVYEFKYDNDGLGDPLINRHHAVALGLATYEQIDYIYSLVEKVNSTLIPVFSKAGIKLIDYRVELGFSSDGKIIVADEISPDTSRMWDAATDEKLDKDRFRFDMGFICDSYNRIYSRLKKVTED